MADPMIERPMVKWPGGKFRIAEEIVRHFPKHACYVEAFGGGASVLLHKGRCQAEMLNDVDGALVNFYRVLRDQPDELRRLCELTPFARSEYVKSYRRTSNRLEWARRFVYRSFAGIGSDSALRESGFRTSRDDDRYAPAVSWAGWPAGIPALAARMRGVVIEQRPATRVMEMYDGRETLHYCDPPYLGKTRKANRSLYRAEMRSPAAHEKLIGFLSELKGMVVLSGYGNAVYDTHCSEARGWRRVKIEGARDQINRRRDEWLWMRNVPEQQPELFSQRREVAHAA